MMSALGVEVAKRLAAERLARGGRPHSALYVAHMKSAKWFGIRDRVLARDKHVCQGCLAAAAVHVHHLCYDHLGDELLFELVALCAGCHARAHVHPKTGNERRKRGGDKIDKKLRDASGKVIY